MIQPRRAALSLALIAGAALGLLVLAAYSPQQFSFYPQCLFHRVTGLNCPGCGGTRCIHALLNGHLGEACHDNALVLLFLPVLVLGVWRHWWPWVRGLTPPPDLALNTWKVYAIAGTVIAFAVLRNLPVFSFLSPG